MRRCHRPVGCQEERVNNSRQVNIKESAGAETPIGEHESMDGEHNPQNTRSLHSPRKINNNHQEPNRPAEARNSIIKHAITSRRLRGSLRRQVGNPQDLTLPDPRATHSNSPDLQVLQLKFKYGIHRAHQENNQPD